MSYYFVNPYNFSYHSLERIKTRLNLENLSDLEIKSYCLKIIKSSYDIIETKTFKYIKINNSQLYFVIRKSNNLVLTISPMSASKLLTVLEENL